MYNIGIKQIVNLACATHLFLEYVGTVSLMSGPSMLPTLAASGEVVIEDRLSLRLNPASLARGDLIVVRSPIDPTAIVCKRVIGLPGDVVCVDPTGLKAPSTEHVLVPKGHIWICGDNMTHSRDSRDYGPVPIALIRSKLFARVNL
ncbi:peptidase S24/S26A/S26B/S26C [Lentinula edodes]|nr:peptidase S24/S26A/S26B/S26C [Lentinula edodes]